MSQSGVKVIGAALTSFKRRKDDTNFRDWAFDAFGSALAMSDLDCSDIDALYLASESDFFTLQINPVSVVASDISLAGIAATRCEGGGASGQIAVHGAVNAIQSGRARRVAVIGVDPSASSLSGDTMRQLYGYSFDAWIEGASGVTSTALYALSFQAFAAKHGLGEEHLAHVTLQNRANACKNPNAHLHRNDTFEQISGSPMIASPYRRLHCSPLSDGAAALILSSSGASPATRKSAPSIAGIGSSTDHMYLGARKDPGAFSAKTRAMQKACKEADLLPSDIDLAEVYDAFAGAQLQALHALGLSSEIASDMAQGAFAPEGSCAVNLSGGLMGQGAPVGATGVGQTASCALMLEGRYHGGLQPSGSPRYALADTHGGVCTTAAVTILEGGEAK